VQANIFGDLKSQLFDIEERDAITTVQMCIDGQEITVPLDPEKGPRLGFAPDDWMTTYSRVPKNPYAGPYGTSGLKKEWPQMTSSEQEILLIQTAKKIKGLLPRMGEQKFLMSLEQMEDAAEQEEDTRTPEEIKESVLRRKEERCMKEHKRRVKAWEMIDIETVTANCLKKSKGMIYGIEFPWDENMLHKWGAEWLEKALIAAGTLDDDNGIKKLSMEKKTKITTGNNGGKFIMLVKYKRPQAELHTKLFAKVPFPCEGATKTDRLSSSVNKQPQELYEINTSRLLETSLGVDIPTFYYGDISNETSNFILITEAIPFGDKAAMNFGAPRGRKPPLEPFEIEGPYDKCIDSNLRGSPKEYYLLLVRSGARMAGLHRSGKMAPADVLKANFADMSGRPMESWGMNFAGVSGEDPRMYRQRIVSAMDFITDIGKAVFPDFVGTAEWQDKFKRIMMTLNAYQAEIQFWKHMDDDYIAISHTNMNVDNAYFWRDEKGKLCCGAFDFGNFGNTCLGQKLWWWIYCSDYDNLKKNLMTYIQVFIDTLHEHGGPLLDKDKLHMMVILSGMEQMGGLCGAVPQILKMCPKPQWRGGPEWPPIDDRYDDRIAKNIDGKSSCRLYLHVMNTIIKIIEELDGETILYRFLNVELGEKLNFPLKSDELIENGGARVGL